ncbi:hypothetical protein TRIUR3_33031 [Triticum urartu]|uniref:Uncharacterized protein n=1 Tax=Triticum urartu TaxID=4572 RepID=M7YE29_TRIUA|nr:hypothetical protein TRIUR3_33031 [Triticum urartu]
MAEVNARPFPFTPNSLLVLLFGTAPLAIDRISPGSDDARLIVADGRRGTRWRSTCTTSATASRASSPPPSSASPSRPSGESTLPPLRFPLSIRLIRKRRDFDPVRAPIDPGRHTGVVVYGNEYFFGGGIQAAPAGATQYGRPVRVVDLGVTHLPREVFEDYLRDIAPRYTAATYSLLTHNCNNFSNEVAQFLVGAGIPDYILNLPNEVMSSPMGAMIMPMIQNLEATLRNNAAPQTTQFVPTPASISWFTAKLEFIEVKIILLRKYMLYKVLIEYLD